MSGESLAAVGRGKQDLRDETRERFVGIECRYFLTEIRNVRFSTIASGLRTVGIYHGEFDPGSERTLAACLKHASRAARRGNPP